MARHPVLPTSRLRIGFTKAPLWLRVQKRRKINKASRRARRVNKP